MTKAQILAELPNLSPEDLGEIQAKLDELAGNQWLNDGSLSDGDIAALEEGLADLEADPNGGSTWDEVEARLLARLRK